MKNKDTRMKRRVLLMAFLTAVFAEMLFAQVINFDESKMDLPPKGFTPALTGKGKPGRWVVLKDETAPSTPNVLAQTDMDKTDFRFPICIFDSIMAKDVDVTVGFKPVKGSVDQAGGIIWRYKDEDNYYLLRANALENNFRIYHVVNGKRREFGGAKVKVAANEWHSIRIRNIGNLFQAYFDGKILIETTDNTLRNAGRVGLWTKADSYTLFDDFAIQQGKESTK